MKNETNETKVSSLTRVNLYSELLAKDIRTLAHPAAIHEMQRQLDLAVADLKASVMGHIIIQMEAFENGMLWQQMNRKPSYISNAAMMRINRRRRKS